MTCAADFREGVTRLVAVTIRLTRLSRSLWYRCPVTSLICHPPGPVPVSKLVYVNWAAERAAAAGRGVVTGAFVLSMTGLPLHSGRLVWLRGPVR